MKQPPNAQAVARSICVSVLGRASSAKTSGTTVWFSLSKKSLRRQAANSGVSLQRQRVRVRAVVGA